MMGGWKRSALQVTGWLTRDAPSFRHLSTKNKTKQNMTHITHYN